MDFVRDFLYTLISVIISSIIFSLAFDALNNSKLKLFLPLQNAVMNINNKRFLRVVIFIVSVIICITIKDFFKLGYMVLGIMLGFFTSLANIVFSTDINVKK